MTRSKAADPAFFNHEHGARAQLEIATEGAALSSAEVTFERGSAVGKPPLPRERLSAEVESLSRVLRL